jgi:hypothetical protein
MRNTFDTVQKRLQKYSNKTDVSLVCSLFFLKPEFYVSAWISRKDARLTPRELPPWRSFEPLREKMDFPSGIG